MEHLDKVEKESALTFILVVCSTLGDDIIGIWPKDVKKDHINCAHATSSTIATGDDQGAVKLFKFPCPEAGVSLSFGAKEFTQR